MSALGSNMYSNAIEAETNAAIAISNAEASATSVSEASAHVNTALAYASAASVTANAVAWVNGNTYALNDNAISGEDFRTYRKKTASSVTSIDPRSDPTNWVPITPPQSLFRSPRTSNTMLGATDNAKLIDITSGTFSQTFDAAATLGDGWYCYIRNAGTGDITLDPNGSETIDGLASFVMYPGEVRMVQCDGAALRSVLISAPDQIYTGGTAYPDRNNILTAAGTATIPLGLPNGRKGTITKTAATTTIDSPDGWTYKSMTTASTTEVVPFQGTGTLRPYVGGWTAIPPSVAATGNGGVSNCVSDRLNSIIDTGTDVVFGSQSGLAGDSVKIDKTTGAASIVDVFLGASGSVSDLKGSSLHYSAANSKFVAFITSTSNYAYCDIRSSSLGSLSSLEIGAAAPLTHSIKLSDTLFAFMLSSGGGNLFAASVNYSTNTVTKGTGVVSLTNAVLNHSLMRLSDTTFLEIAPTSAGGTISARVNTVSGTTITLGTTYQSAETDTQNQGVRLVRLTDTKFIALVGKNSGTTLGYAYGLTVSGTVVTFTSRLAIPSNNGAQLWFDFAGYQPVDLLTLDTDRVLVCGSSQNCVYVVKFSGGTLSVGSTLTVTGVSKLLTDTATLSNYYYRTATAWGRLIVADTTVSIDYTISSGGATTCMFKEGFSSREFRGSDGTWYALSGGFGSVAYAVTPTLGFYVGSPAKTYKELTV